MLPNPYAIGTLSSRGGAEEPGLSFEGDRSPDGRFLLHAAQIVGAPLTALRFVQDDIMGIGWILATTPAVTYTDGGCKVRANTG